MFCRLSGIWGKKKALTDFNLSLIIVEIICFF